MGRVAVAWILGQLRLQLEGPGVLMAVLGGCRSDGVWAALVACQRDESGWSRHVFHEQCVGALLTQSIDILGNLD